MTKRDIVVKIAKEMNFVQSDVATIVQATLDAIAEELAAGKSIELRNFGVFEINVRKGRVGRNPNQPEIDVPIPERAVVKFRAGRELKNAVEIAVIGIIKWFSIRVKHPAALVSSGPNPLILLDWKNDPMYNIDHWSPIWIANFNILSDKFLSIFSKP